MIDTFAQILDEAYWGLMAQDNLEALERFEAIIKLIEDAEEAMKAEMIPVEMVIT